jgi:hypothetical protein
LQRSHLFWLILFVGRGWVEHVEDLFKFDSFLSHPWGLLWAFLVFLLLPVLRYAVQLILWPLSEIIWLHAVAGWLPDRWVFIDMWEFSR